MPITRSMSNVFQSVSISIPFYTLYNSYELEQEKIQEYFNCPNHYLTNPTFSNDLVDINFKTLTNNFLDFSLELSGKAINIIKYLNSKKNEIIELITEQTIMKMYNQTFEEPVHNTISYERLNELIAPIDPIIDETCRICLETLTENPVKTSCGHNFHKNCISDYLTGHCIHPICPICRFDLH
jgi:hypothetical protein